MLRSLCWISALAFTAACASTPGASPHDMGAAQHSGEAQVHAAAADTHVAQYDANAAVERTRCLRKGGHSAGADLDGACWTSVTNPTTEHLRVAEEHRRHAADHRAASTALRDAEARACAGISAEDRDMSPFEHREDVESVEPLVERTGPDKLPTERTVGAIVTFRAVPGMTAQWLQRVVDCHLARNAALGHAVPEMEYCPLVLQGATARVTSSDVGFAVAIRSEDAHTGQEILRRARSLLSR